MGHDFITFGAPDIQQAEIDEVVASMASGWLGTGPKVQRFEKAFADYKGVSDARVAAVNSCTAALHVSLLAAGIRPGDEVITTSMTFCATANAVIHAGGIPVPVDIEPDTLNIDPDKIEDKISDRTRAIVPVHFAGRPCDMDAIMRIADRHHLVVIEDCAHAIEAEWRGRPVGTIGDFGCFSFYVTKNVVTGEGGMIVSRSSEAIERIKILALHGMSKDAWHRYSDRGYKHYHVVDAGFKYNMMDLQAAIGLHQLERVEASYVRRREIWDRYRREFDDLPIRTPGPVGAEMRHAYHLFTLQIDEEACGMTRDEFLDAMTKNNIGVGVHYLCLAEHPYYQERFGWQADQFPIATRYGRTTVSVPLSPKLSDAEVDYIARTVRRLVEEHAPRATKART